MVRLNKVGPCFCMKLLLGRCSASVGLFVEKKVWNLFLFDCRLVDSKDILQ